MDSYCRFSIALPCVRLAIEKLQQLLVWLCCSTQTMLVESASTELLLLPTIDAQLFKSAFEDAQKSNAELPASSAAAPAATETAASSSEVHGDKVSQE